MPTSSDSLPDNVETLREIILQQQAQLEEFAEQSEHVAFLEEYIRLLKHQRFGASSEKASSGSRLEKDRFPWPRTADESVICLTGRELNWLLDGIDIFSLRPHETLHFESVL